jgi:hypothetical protein
MKRPVVKLSPYERALNRLNDLSPAHQTIFSEAMEDLRRQRDELKKKLKTEAEYTDSYIRRTHEAESQRDAARAVLAEVADLYPYLPCVCGRQKNRMSEALRASVLNALRGGTPIRELGLVRDLMDDTLDEVKE